MTIRAYVRWPRSKVSHKTSTDNREVAELAFRILLSTRDQLESEGAWAIVLNDDGRQIEYHVLNPHEQAGRPGNS